MAAIEILFKLGLLRFRNAAAIFLRRVAGSFRLPRLKWPVPIHSTKLIDGSVCHLIFWFGQTKIMQSFSGSTALLQPFFAQLQVRQFPRRGATGVAEDQNYSALEIAASKRSGNFWPVKIGWGSSEQLLPHGFQTRFQ